MRPASPLLVTLAIAPCSHAIDTVAYVSDLSNDRVVRLVDRNGDGDLNDPTEATVFFGPGNASGFPGVGSAQCLLVLALDDILAADGEEAGPFQTRVFRLRDLNGDGDAMDAGEATVFWDATLPLPGSPNYDRPKELLPLPDGTLLLADNNTINFDNDAPEALWLLDDADASGAIDPGEVTLYKELCPIGEPFCFISEDFKRRADGTIVFSNLDSSTNSTNVWFLGTDLSLTPFFDGGALFGQAVKETGMALDPSSKNPVFAGEDIFGISRIIELRDGNMNGTIDGNAEAPARYRSDLSPTGIAWDINDVLDVDFAPDGSLWLLVIDDALDDRIIRFEDTDDDGLFISAGEAADAYTSSAAIGEQIDFPRTVVFACACPGDVSTTGDPNGLPDGATDLADLLFFVNVWDADLGTTPDSRADVTTTGTGFGDALHGIPDGTVDLADLLFFVNRWQVGLTSCQ